MRPVTACQSKRLLYQAVLERVYVAMTTATAECCFPSNQSNFAFKQSPGLIWLRTAPLLVDTFSDSVQP